MRDRAGAALARMTAVQAAMVGTLQCLALWPGTSRSFVTIVGGLLVGLGAVAAAEFSFLLGLVTLTAASGYSVLKVAKADGGAQFVAALGGWLPIACGIAVAWASAALSIDLLVRYLQRHTLALFGWWLALGHIVSAALLALTIIGIPFAYANLKLVPVSLTPFGREVVSKAVAAPGAVSL